MLVINNFNFKEEFMANFIICLLLFLAVFFAVRKLHKNKKSGKTSCGCDCSSCNACSMSKKD